MDTPPLTLRVFLSSPGDVAEERRLAREVMRELAASHLLRRRVHLDVVAGDNGEASRPMAPFEPPLEFVNRQELRRPADCDLTIVILWGRLGTPLPPETARPDGSLFASGSVWEYEDARAANRPVFLYRRTATPHLAINDPDFEHKRAQYAAVSAFVAQFTTSDSSLQGGVNTYARPEEFRALLRQHLEAFVTQRLASQLLSRRQDRPGALPARARDAVQDRRVQQGQKRKATEGTTGHPNRRVFLCYRRHDSASFVGRFHDRLATDLGRHNIFKDVDDIPYGVDFVEHLSQEVEKCTVLFAVIGPRWLDTGPNHASRLEDPNDFVRIEIAAALQRQIPVVPLLVDGAQMPRADQLPEELKSLARRHGTDIRNDPDFHSDVTRLLSRLAGRVEVERLERTSGARSPGRQRWNETRFFSSLATTGMPPPVAELARGLRDLAARHPGDITLSWGAGLTGSMVVKLNGAGIVEVFGDGELRFRPSKFTAALGPQVARDYGAGLDRLVPSGITVKSNPGLAPTQAAMVAPSLYGLIEQAIGRALPSSGRSDDS